jgi:hypothetical protein
VRNQADQGIAARCRRPGGGWITAGGVSPIKALPRDTRLTLG